MDTFKEVVSFLGAIVSLFAALIPVIGYLADRKRRERRPVDQSPPPLIPVAEVPPRAEVGWNELPPNPAPAVGPKAFEQVRLLVRRPALVMLGVGCVSLVTNLFVAGVGFVDEFVTPLGISAPERHDSGAQLAPPGANASPTFEDPQSAHASARLGLITILGFAVTSAVSIWSAYSMLNLRNYWLALAGSVAVMPGSCVCCLPGVPSGIWSIVVLLRPEVAAAFR